MDRLPERSLGDLVAVVEAPRWRLRRAHGAVLRLAAPGAVLGDPGVATEALLGGGVQRPVGVVEVGAAEGAQVGAAGEDRRVDVVVAGDRADGDRRDLDLVADPVGERGLEAAPEGRRRWSGQTWPVETSTMSTSCARSIAASATASSPSKPPGTQSVAEMRTDSGFSAGQAARQASSDLEREAGAAGEVAAVLVRRAGW